jgi:hypothetical protein
MNLTKIKAMTLNKKKGMKKKSWDYLRDLNKCTEIIGMS